MNTDGLVSVGTIGNSYEGRTIRAYCEGFVFVTPRVDGWKERLREWKARVNLQSGSRLEIREVVDGHFGKPYYSTIS